MRSWSLLTIRADRCWRSLGISSHISCRHQSFQCPVLLRCSYITVDQKTLNGKASNSLPTSRWRFKPRHFYYILFLQAPPTPLNIPLATWWHSCKHSCPTWRPWFQFPATGSYCVDVVYPLCGGFFLLWVLQFHPPSQSIKVRFPHSGGAARRRQLGTDLTHTFRHPCQTFVGDDVKYIRFFLYTGGSSNPTPVVVASCLDWLSCS